MQLDVEDLEYQVETCKHYLKQIDKWRARVQFMGPSHFEGLFHIFLNNVKQKNVACFDSSGNETLFVCLYKCCCCSNRKFFKDMCKFG